MAPRFKMAPHVHPETWVSDIGQRTTWRVITMEVYGYLAHYSRLWLKRPRGHGRHEDMSGIPQEPLLAVSCHQPSLAMGRCRPERLEQTFGHPWAASYLLNPLLMHKMSSHYFRSVINQKTLSTGMTAIAFAQQLCGKVR